MELTAIVGVVQKGLVLIEGLIEAGASAIPAINALRELLNKSSNLTDADLEAAEAVLDDLIEEFNLDI